MYVFCEYNIEFFCHLVCLNEINNTLTNTDLNLDENYNTKNS